MMVNPLIFACVLLVVGVLFTPSDSRAMAQTNGQVEVKTDRGIITVELKETSLIKKPDHKLTLSLETLFNSESPGNESYVADFFSYSKSAVPFGDLTIHCLVDGKLLSLKKAQRPEDRDRARPRASDEFYTLFDLQDLEKMASGTKVEMRIGSVEWTIPDQSLLAIREFVNTAKRHKESLKKAK